MKHLFISHCQVTQVYGDAKPEERTNYFAKMKESAKEYGINLVFWGVPWGVLESLTIVLESEKSLDNYFSWRRAWGQRQAQLGLKPYMSASNTVTVTAME